MAGFLVEDVNPSILRKCREQIGLGLQEAGKKATIKPDRMRQLESGASFPTFKQLERLAEVYCVPLWVFLRGELVDEYNFEKRMPAFRRFSQESQIFNDYSTRVITARVEELRELILELRVDMDEPVEPFSPPPLQKDPATMASSAREWLGRKEGNYSFQEWRQAFESRGVFVFLTSKYSSWSKLDPGGVRGFSVYKETLPIIVINDSDAYKAQSFTLFHELGHLLRKENAIDGQTPPYAQRGIERWCDQFAGEALMPGNAFLHKTEGITIAGKVEEYVKEINKVAHHFQVSRLACAVRMCQLGKMTNKEYDEVQKLLRKEHENEKQKLKNKPTPLARKIHQEKLNQYGGIYSRALLQAYYNQEIGLHKLCKLFELKRVKDVRNLEGLLI